MPSARQIPPRNKKAYLKVSGFDGFPTAVLTASGSKGWDKIPLSKTLQPKRFSVNAPLACTPKRACRYSFFPSKYYHFMVSK
jgi:hypothetical protein